MNPVLHQSFLTMLDYTPEQFAYYLNLAAQLKKDKKEGKEAQTLKGKNFALIFEKDSTRTRCAFEVAARDQGAYTTYLGPTGSQIGKKESIADTARVLGSMFDAIEFRGFDQSAVEELSEKAGVPVWNGLTDYDHPTQTLANFLTLKEHFKNVTANEAFFQGHFPQEPVMPGVLQVEAMAQAGGLMVLNSVEEPERWSTYFLRLDNVKFRKKVVPGDTLIFRVELIAPIRHGISTMHGFAFVGETIVMEATFTAQIVKNK